MGILPLDVPFVGLNALFPSASIDVFRTMKLLHRWCKDRVSAILPNRKLAVLRRLLIGGDCRSTRFSARRAPRSICRSRNCRCNFVPVFKFFTAFNAILTVGTKF